MSRREFILHELVHHLPFSVGSAIVSLGFVALLTWIGVSGGRLHDVFHFFHPVHLLISAAATSAMFWRHDRRWGRAVLVVVLATIPLCSASDILLPYLGGKWMGREMEPLHVCLIEEPILVWPFIFLGVGCGILAEKYVTRSTFYSHSAHVLVAGSASTLYFTGFGSGAWATLIGWLLLLLLVCVMIPCILHDIVIPLVFASREPHVHLEGEHVEGEGPDV